MRRVLWWVRLVMLISPVLLLWLLRLLCILKLRIPQVTEASNTILSGICLTISLAEEAEAAAEDRAESAEESAQAAREEAAEHRAERDT